MTKTHASGSAITYGMRYLLKMIFNISVGESEDDGNAAAEVGFISEDQANSIRDLIDEAGVDIKRFCAYFKVDGIAKIPAKEYNRAVAAINSKRRARA